MPPTAEDNLQTAVAAVMCVTNCDEGQARWVVHSIAGYVMRFYAEELKRGIR